MKKKKKEDKSEEVFHFDYIKENVKDIYLLDVLASLISLFVLFFSIAQSQCYKTIYESVNNSTQETALDDPAGYSDSVGSGENAI